MEVRYTIQDSPQHKALLKDIAKQVYRGKPLARLIKLCDVLLLLPFAGIAAFVFFQIGGLIDTGLLDWCMEEGHPQFRALVWTRWALLIGTYLAVQYAVAIRPAMNSRLIRQALSSFIYGENLLAVHDDGLYHAGHYGHTLLHYHEVRRIADMRGFLVIFVGNGHFHAVPYSAFASDKERQQFADLLQSKLAAAGKTQHAPSPEPNS